MIARYEFERQIETIIAGHMVKAYPYQWDEDHITFGILRDFQENFRRIQIADPRLQIEVEWEIYKLLIPEETNFGDIGILLSAQLRDGTQLVGAGFIEAKIRDITKHRFLQIRQKQNAHIIRNAPNAQTLLYSPADVPVFDPAAYDAWPWFFIEPPLAAKITRGPVVPISLVHATKKKDVSLYDLACSPSFQFVHRYFNCLDLEFSRDAIDAVRGFPKKLGQPNYILKIRLAPLDHELPRMPDVNTDAFAPIERARR